MNKNLLYAMATHLKNLFNFQHTILLIHRQSKHLNLYTAKSISLNCTPSFKFKS